MKFRYKAFELLRFLEQWVVEFDEKISAREWLFTETFRSTTVTGQSLSIELINKVFL